MGFCFRAQRVYSMNMSFLPALSWKTKNIRVMPRERPTKYDRKLISTPILCRPAPRTIPLQTPWKRVHQCKHVQMHTVNTKSYSNLSSKISPLSYNGGEKFLRLCGRADFLQPQWHQGHPTSIVENICSEDDLRSRILGTFIVKFLACLPLLRYKNIYGITTHF